MSKLPGRLKTLLPLLLFLAQLLQPSSCQYYQVERACAIFNSEENFRGGTFTLRDRDQSVNLPGDHRALNSGWNATNSITVETGCRLQLCSDLYFDGECKTLTHGSYPNLASTALNLPNIASAMCNCYKECKCSDIYMKKSSCAQAYLQDGCNTCHSPYTDLKGNMSFFNEDFIGKVTALRIRKGCTLTLYSEEELEGEAEVFTDEIVESYEKTFYSYKCECDDSQFVKPPKRPLSPSYPLQIDIPGSVDGVLRMLRNTTLSKHPGLRAAQMSLKNRRSSKNAYILLLGSTGSGKSSAINMLFDANVTAVCHGTSCTTDILEFRVPVPVEEIGVANSELRVIDTPGMGDTRGLQHDAHFLATLDTYLSNHEELKDRIPNVVLFFHKFHDNRFDGEGSSFVKMLRGFDSFRERITDSDYSNVIFVLSHFCSETKIHQKRPERRLAKFKSVLENYSYLPKPIIITVAENKPEEHDLPTVNSYFKLPNNEYYPKNLFEKMELVTEKGGDMMGLGVFRSAFRDSEDFNVTYDTFKIIERSSKFDHYFHIISNAAFNIQKSPVSEKLKQTWDSSLSTTLKKQFPSSLPYLQKVLNLQNIYKAEDVPRTATGILKLLSSIKQDEATLQLLKKALNIEAPSFTQNTIAGFCYDVFKDHYLPKSPFKLGAERGSDIGFSIPSILTCNKNPGNKQISRMFEDRQGYIEHRLSSLGIEGNIKLENFEGCKVRSGCQPGCNIKTMSFTEDGGTLSAIWEFRQFDFILNEKFELTPEFAQTVRSLPVFDNGNYRTVDAWRKFFTDYGTHVVTSIYGGGAIEIQLKSDKSQDWQRLSDVMFQTIQIAEDISFRIGDQNEEANDTTTANLTLPGEGATLPNGIEQLFTFRGGDSAYHTNYLTKMSIEQASKLLTNWKASLKFNPVLLTSEMRLMPLSQIVVKKLGQNYSSEIDRATQLLFNSELKPKPLEESHLEKRQQTQLMNDFFTQVTDSNQKIHEMIMEMRKMDDANLQQRLAHENATRAWQQQQQLAEQQFRREMAEAQKLAEDRRIQRQDELEKARLAQEKLRHDQFVQMQKDMMAAQKLTAEEMLNLMKIMATATPPPPIIIYSGGGSCLREGTNILMADLSEKSVEALEVGELVMDKDLRPSKVLGVAFEFLLEQKFYGFGNDSFFFTESHLFVGPSEASSSSSDIRLYAQSPSNLYKLNPLMEYLDVRDLTGPEGVEGSAVLFQLQNVNNNADPASTITRHVNVFQDPDSYSPDTKIYFIQVDSPTGTYFANGYVCRHEIPPMEHWPNTMSLLFRLMDTPTFQQVAEVPYHLETVNLLRDISDKVAASVEAYIVRQVESNWGDDDGVGQSPNQIFEEKSNGKRYHDVMTLAEVDVEECILAIFNNPTVSSLGVGLYAKIGRLISPHLDSAAYGRPDAIGGKMGQVQHEIFNVIHDELQKHLKL